MKTSGFTLIELAIVIVIIGLLAGSILVGRDLIRSSLVRKTIAQEENLNSAVNSFRSKYACLPGDCANASDYNFTSIDGDPAHINGDGDEHIGFTNSMENYNSIHQLGEAGLLAVSHNGLLTDLGNTADKSYFPPALPSFSTADRQGFWILAYFQSDPSMDVIAQKPGNYLWITTNLSGDSDVPTLLPQDTYSIDVKIDDGLPLLGAMRASNNDMGDDSTGPYGNTTGPAGANSNVCVTNETPPHYNVLNISRAEGSLCSIIIQAGF